MHWKSCNVKRRHGGTVEECTAENEEVVAFQFLDAHLDEQADGFHSAKVRPDVVLPQHFAESGGIVEKHLCAQAGKEEESSRQLRLSIEQRNLQTIGWSVLAFRYVWFKLWLNSLRLLQLSGGIKKCKWFNEWSFATTETVHSRDSSCHK